MVMASQQVLGALGTRGILKCKLQSASTLIFTQFSAHITERGQGDHHSTTTQITDSYREWTVEQTLWRRLMSWSLYSLVPSIMPVSGLANHSLNSIWDWKTLGMRKCMSDHSSIRLFCKGVPVRSSRLWLLKFSKVCQRWDLKFLMFCACRYKKFNQLSFLNHDESQTGRLLSNSKVRIKINCLYYGDGYNMKKSSRAL